MRKSVLALAFVAGILVAGPAAADPIVSPLNCEIGGGGCTAISTFGTLTFDTSGDNVTIAVNSTVQSDPLKIQTVFLNVNESTIPLGSTFTLLSGATVLDTYTVTAYNSEQADGCATCLFDLEFNIANDNIFEPVTLTLDLTSGSGTLAVTDIFVANTAGLDAAIHFGNCGVAPCNGTLSGNQASIFVGETPPTVPEPTSLVLLGAGLTGLGIWARRRASRD